MIESLDFSTDLGVYMLKVIKRVAFMLVITTLAGCATKVTQTAIAPTLATSSKAAKVPGGTVVAIMSANDDVKARSDWSDFLEQWQKSLTNAAEDQAVSFIFANDESSMPANAAVLVRIHVNDFKYVSQVKRYMLGVMAGNATMDVDAKYISLPANEPFGAKNFNTSSSGWEGIFSAMTPKQVEAVSNMIVKEVIALAPTR